MGDVEPSATRALASAARAGAESKSAACSGRSEKRVAREPGALVRRRPIGDRDDTHAQSGTCVARRGSLQGETSVTACAPRQEADLVPGPHLVAAQRRVRVPAGDEEDAHRAA